jgi:hypothetical protein
MKRFSFIAALAAGGDRTRSFFQESLMQKNMDRESTLSAQGINTSQVDLFRRKFLAGLGMAGAAVALGTGFGVGKRASAAVPPSEINDVNILNFALNLEYLEASYYLIALNGTGLAADEMTGVGNQGVVHGGSQVSFAIPAVQMYAEQLANDEHNHVLDLRAALGDAAVAMPTINLKKSFTNAAIAAGIITAGQTFNPFDSDADFLLGAFVFEDVGVTAYHGAAGLISSPAILSAAAGVMAVEAYHAGAIRTALFQAGQSDASLITAANAIVALRATADSSGGNNNETPLVDSDNMLHIVAADPDTSIAYSRHFGSVLRIVYLGNQPGAGGGFFPDGMNGVIF